MRENIDISDNIKFGCEVEFNSTYKINELEKIRKKDKNNFKIEYDCYGSTLKEAISPIMCKNNLNELKNILEILKRYNGYIKGNEGAHIHFDHSILNYENLVTMLKMWYVSENIIYEFAKGDCSKLRDGYSTYARELNYTLHSFINQYEDNHFKLNDFKIFAKNNGLNLKNYIEHNKDKNTIEIRIPNGTLNYEIWLNNIEFYANFFNYCNDINNKEYINYLFKKEKDLNEDDIANTIYKNEESKQYFKKQMSGEYVNEKRYKIWM